MQLPLETLLACPSLLNVRRKIQFTPMERLSISMMHNRRSLQRNKSDIVTICIEEASDQLKSLEKAIWILQRHGQVSLGLWGGYLKKKGKEKISYTILIIFKARFSWKTHSAFVPGSRSAFLFGTLRSQHNPIRRSSWNAACKMYWDILCNIHYQRYQPHASLWSPGTTQKMLKCI